MLFESPTIMGAFKLESFMHLEKLEILQNLEINPTCDLDMLPSETLKTIKINSECVPFTQVESLLIQMHKMKSPEVYTTIRATKLRGVKAIAFCNASKLLKKDLQ